MSKISQIILALDNMNLKEAKELCNQLDPKKCKIKIGSELFIKGGQDFIKELHNKNFKIFLDLKWFDIPNTCQKAAIAAAEIGLWAIDIHYGVGEKTLKLVKQELIKNNFKTKLIGVTILTSTAFNLNNQKNLNTAEEAINTCCNAELDGIVCPVKFLQTPKLKSIIEKQKNNKEFIIITPGIRDISDHQNDQKAIENPIAAQVANSDYLVIGRMITKAPDPIAKLNSILADLEKN